MKDILRYKNIIAAAAIAFVFFLLVRSILDHYSVERKKVARKMEELVQDDEAIGKWKELAEKYSQISQAFLQKDNLLLKKYIEEQARSLDVRIFSLKTDYSEAEFYWDVSVELQVSCFYGDLIKFIKALEKKSIKINRLSINRQKNQAQVRVSMNLKTVIIQ